MRSGDDENWKFPADRDCPGKGPAYVRLLRQLAKERQEVVKRRYMRPVRKAA